MGFRSSAFSVAADLARLDPQHVGDRDAERVGLHHRGDEPAQVGDVGAVGEHHHFLGDAGRVDVIGDRVDIDKNRRAVFPHDSGSRCHITKRCGYYFATAGKQFQCDLNGHCAVVHAQNSRLLQRKMCCQLRFEFTNQLSSVCQPNIVECALHMARVFMDGRQICFGYVNHVFRYS